MSTPDRLKGYKGRARARLLGFGVREPHDGCLILQGGLPETEEFISSHWK